jgi:hypothetical protein
MEQAIQKAVEGGGYDTFGLMYEGDKVVVLNPIKYRILLDPLFWQALGKAEEWAGSMPSTYCYDNDIPEWQHNWHFFIDKLILGQDIESFFANLLK